MKRSNLFFLFVSILVISSCCTKSIRRDGAGNTFPETGSYLSNNSSFNSVKYGNFWEDAASYDPNNTYNFELLSSSGSDSPLYYLVYSLPETCDVKIGINTLTGKDVDSYDFGNKTPGSYMIKWETLAPNGIYLVNITACDTIMTIKITLSR